MPHTPVAATAIGAHSHTARRTTAFTPTVSPRDAGVPIRPGHRVATTTPLTSSTARSSTVGPAPERLGGSNSRAPTRPRQPRARRPGWPCTPAPCPFVRGLRCRQPPPAGRRAPARTRRGSRARPRPYRVARRSPASRERPPARWAASPDPGTARSRASDRPPFGPASPRQGCVCRRGRSRYLRCAGRPHEDCAWEGCMKLLFFDDFRLGVLHGGDVVDVTEVVKDIPHLDPQQLIRGVIERFADYRQPLEDAAARGQGRPLDSVRVRPPLPHPANIICMAVNYMEDGTRSEPAPINAFMKSPSAIIGPGDTMVLPDVAATIFEGEAEVAVVIAKRATAVPAERAMEEYVFGYTNFIDGSARGMQPAAQSFYQMKSRDTFAPIGPYLVTADEISDPHKLAIKLWNNGTLYQSFNTDDMAHKIPRCIEWVTSIHTLEPGDILATGTNHRGLSAFQDGDRIEIESEGLGRLTFNVKDELKRTWGRETRLDRQNKKLEGQTPQLTGKYAKTA